MLLGLHGVRNLVVSGHRYGCSVAELPGTLDLGTYDLQRAAVVVMGGLVFFIVEVL